MVRSRKDSVPDPEPTPEGEGPAADVGEVPVAEVPAAEVPTTAEPETASTAWWATATGADAPGARADAPTVPFAPAVPAASVPAASGPNTAPAFVPANSAVAAPATPAQPGPRSWPGWGWALTSLAAVVVVSAAVALGVSSLVASSDQRAAAVSAVRQRALGADGTGTAAAAKRAVIRGTVTAIDADSVTISTLAGSTQTLRLTATTAYGTVKKPSELSAIAVGDSVIAVESRSADATPAALRLAVRPDGKGA